MGSVECLKLLMKCGVDPNAQDFIGHTALSVTFYEYVKLLGDYAVDEDCEECKRPDWCDCMVMDNMVNLCFELVGHGAKVDLRNHRGYALIHNFCSVWLEENIYTKKERALKLLVELGANIDQESDFQHTTPLQDACVNGHVSLACMLIVYGASVNTKGRMGQTALHYAAMAGHADCVQLLIEWGADVNVCDRKGESPTDKAERWQRTECLEMLQKANQKPLKRNLEEPNGQSSKVMKMD